jgi:curved DNA-binding protein CbpA
MGGTSSKHEEYKEYYVKNNKENISNVDLNSLDPYKVLGVSKNFTWNELKVAYKNAAVSTHPDKKGGNKVVFEFVTNCFKSLANEYKNREANKSHTDLKKQSNEFFDKIIETNAEHPSHILSNKDEPFETKFNNAFNDCKYHDDEYEFGYGNIMEKSCPKRNDIEIKNIFNKDKVDNSTFNDIFNKNVPVSKEVIKYKEPEALMMAKQLKFTEIGALRSDDYSSSVENKGLGYTDYMKAYNGMRLINPDDIKKKDFKSIQEYEKYSDSKIKRGLNSREKNLIEKKKNEEEKQEFERIERIKKQDIAIQQSHDRANRILLK